MLWTLLLFIVAPGLALVPLSSACAVGGNTYLGNYYSGQSSCNASKPISTSGNLKGLSTVTNATGLFVVGYAQSAGVVEYMIRCTVSGQSAETVYNCTLTINPPNITCWDPVAIALQPYNSSITVNSRHPQDPVGFTISADPMLWEGLTFDGGIGRLSGTVTVARPETFFGLSVVFTGPNPDVAYSFQCPWEAVDATTSTTATSVADSTTTTTSSSGGLMTLPATALACPSSKNATVGQLYQGRLVVTETPVSTRLLGTSSALSFLSIDRTLDVVGTPTESGVFFYTVEAVFTSRTLVVNCRLLVDVVPENVAADEVVSIPGSATVSESAVSGQVAVGGNLTVLAALSVRARGRVEVSGRINLAGVLSVTPGGRLRCTGRLIIDAAAVLQLVIPALSTTRLQQLRTTSSVMTTVVEYDGGRQGEFASTEVVYEGESCVVVTSSDVTYGSSTATALVMLDDGACNAAEGLTSGQLAGIIVGSVVGAALIVIAIVGILLHRRSRQKSIEEVRNKIELG